MTYEEFKDEVYMMLGDSLIEVELTDDDIKLAFRRAKRTFQQIGPDNWRKGYFCISAKRDQVNYLLPKEINTVVKIIKPSSLVWNVEDPLSLAAYNNLFSGFPTSISAGGDWLSLELMAQQVEIWNRYSSHDVDFIHDKHSSSIRLLQPPRGDQRYILEVYRSLDDEEYMDMIWIQNWSIAEAKKMLGMAYRKFSSLPSPDGSSVSLGGDQLIQEANEEMRMLKEDVDNQISGDVDWYGVYIG